MPEFDLPLLLRERQHTTKTDGLGYSPAIGHVIIGSEKLNNLIGISMMQEHINLGQED